MDNESFNQIGENLGLGAGGLLLLRVGWWVLSKVNLKGKDYSGDISELTRVQKSTLEELANDRSAFTEFIESFSELVARVDGLESSFEDRRVEIDNALDLGDKEINKHDSRIESLESEDKELNKIIAQLSKDNAVIMTEIKPIQQNITDLKANQTKIFDLLTNMNTNISTMMGRMNGI